MRQGFTQFGGDERMLPIGLKILPREGHRPGFVIEQGDADFVAKGGFKLAHQLLESGGELRQSKLSAEDQARIARGAIPKEDVEFVSNKPRQRAFSRIADELAE